MSCCLLRAASGGGCLLPEAFAVGREAGAESRCPPSPHCGLDPLVSPKAHKGQTPSPGPERCIYGQVDRRPDGVGLWEAEAEELLGNQTGLTYTDALFSQAPGPLRVEETSTHITVSGGGGGGGGALVALGFKYSEHHDTETSRRLVQGDGHEP